MPAKKVCLKAVMTNWEGTRIWTGEYACSICGMRFRPDPSDPAKLSLEFATHRTITWLRQGSNLTRSR
jgi:hypothetical protein